jgi:hypothetical protein
LELARSVALLRQYLYMKLQIALYLKHLNFWSFQ